MLPDTNGLPPIEMGRLSIFVQIVSYRDSECKHTIHDLYTKASFPERVYIGLNWQYAEEDGDIPFFAQPYQERIRLTRAHYTDSKGACWARSLTESSYDGEDYVLNIDAHMRFVSGWDERLISLHHKLVYFGHPKPVLTCYPPAYSLQEGYLDEDLSKMVPEALIVGGTNRRIFKNHRRGKVPPGSEPFLHACVAAGFLFAPGSMIEEVPYDRHLYFFGEEVTLAVRLWTHGYDLFHPATVLAYHLYKRKRIPSTGKIIQSRAISTHHGEHEDANELNARSYARVRHLVGTEFSVDSEVIKDIAEYGLGNSRTIYQFSRFSGLDFQTFATRPFCRHAIYFSERLPAGAQEETACLESAERSLQEGDLHAKGNLLISALSATDSRTVLDLGGLFHDAIPDLPNDMVMDRYLAFTASPEKAIHIRQQLRGHRDGHAVEINYAAEQLPVSDLVLLGGLATRLPSRILWQLLDSIRFSGSRFLCVEHDRAQMRLVDAPYYLPSPLFEIPCSADGKEVAIWDLTAMANFFEALPEQESRARRVILDTLSQCVATIQAVFKGMPDLFQSLLAASGDLRKDQARTIFDRHDIQTHVKGSGVNAERALDLWWCLRWRNFEAARKLIRHPLLNEQLQVNSWFMQATAWDYFDDLAKSKSRSCRNTFGPKQR